MCMCSPPLLNPALYNIPLINTYLNKLVYTNRLCIRFRNVFNNKINFNV